MLPISPRSHRERGGDLHVVHGRGEVDDGRLLPVHDRNRLVLRLDDERVARVVARRVVAEQRRAVAGVEPSPPVVPSPVAASWPGVKAEPFELPPHAPARAETSGRG